MKPILREREGAGTSEAERRAIEDLTRWFPRVLLPDIDYTTATSFARILTRLRKKVAPRASGPRIAVVGSFTTHQLVELFDLYLHGAGTEATLYEAAYGTLHQELLDPDSGLNKFRPDLVIILTTWRDLAHRPALATIGRRFRRRSMRKSRSGRESGMRPDRGLGCQIIQNNFDAPPWRPLGNLEARHPGGFGRFVSLVNHALQDAAPPYVTIHDVDHLAATWGRWAVGRRAVLSPRQAPLPARAPGRLRPQRGLAGPRPSSALGKKCLVLDLDNTLWGGVIGDDGLGGIRLGQGDARGRGVPRVPALRQGARPARRDPGGLQQEHRLDRPRGLREAPRDGAAARRHLLLRRQLGRQGQQPADGSPSELNIGLNSLVFVDDNPAERSIVRRLRPEVAVPEVPEDPGVLHPGAGAAPLLPGPGAQRRGPEADRVLPGRRRARRRLESSADDLDGFLRSLEMVARVGPVDAVDAGADRAADQPIEPVQPDDPPPLERRRAGA